MKMRHLLGLALLATAFSRPALAQTTPSTTTPSTTVTPGTPINPSNTTAPVIGNGTIVPGQPGTPPPVETPPGTVYSAPSTSPTSAKKTNVQTRARTKRSGTSGKP